MLKFNEPFFAELKERFCKELLQNTLYFVERERSDFGENQAKYRQML
jgi:hypothetical protein